MIAIMCTDDGMEISEYCDYRLVNKIALQKESVGYRILQMVNDKILSIGDIASFIPNRSLDTPSPFLIRKMRHSGILPASVRILFPATPRRSPLRLRLGEKHAA